MKKQVLSFALVATMVSSIVAGCSSEKKTGTGDSTSTDSSAAVAPASTTDTAKTDTAVKDTAKKPM